eukprot:CAMPEP_0170456360 /NCGR_PEP_ID=MMETSP0123-20130129/4023_1 /TAXON_ID=182087 /ORGANISM="Favella ehrenbergii, Strain Fehren 1" /LENGTH=48 /DNA_ID= /DNA_START= /DNA_END= /DNA_ORIENTATION=
MTAARIELNLRVLKAESIRRRRSPDGLQDAPCLDRLAILENDSVAAIW